MQHRLLTFKIFLKSHRVMLEWNRAELSTAQQAAPSVAVK